MPDLIKVWVDDQLGTEPKIKPDIYRTVIAEAPFRFPCCHPQLLIRGHKAVLRADPDIIALAVRDLPVDAEFIDLTKGRGAWYIPCERRDRVRD
jgi:hypothetical protein